jgi:hypothetical protein
MNKSDLLIYLSKELSKSLEKEKTSVNSVLINWKDRQEGYTNAIMDLIDYLLRTKE